jgi:hypothetical protein
MYLCMNYIEVAKNFMRNVFFSIILGKMQKKPFKLA